MQARTRPAVWLDRILGTMLLLGGSALWFWARTGKWIPALFLSIGWTALMLYARVLLARRRKKRVQGREKRTIAQRKAVYALTMLPYAQALDEAAQSLCKTYALRSLFTVGKLHYAEDSMHRRIAIQLMQCPQPVQIAQVYAFHRIRRQDFGVLLCSGGAAEDAQSYAEGLSPPLRLVDVRQLPLSEALAKAFASQCEPKQRRTASVIKRMLRPTLALRYVLLSTLLIGMYLLTDRLSVLLPALALQLLALMSRAGNTDNKKLF